MNKKDIEKINKMSQAEKEKAQLDCLKDAFLKKRKRMTVKEMSAYLKTMGFSKGASEKTIYRRIIPKLEQFDIEKEYANYKRIKKYRLEENRGVIGHDQIMYSIKILSGFLKNLNPVDKKIVSQFLEYEKSVHQDNSEALVYYIPLKI